VARLEEAVEVLRPPALRYNGLQVKVEAVQDVIDHCGCRDGRRLEYLEGIPVAEYECGFCRPYREALGVK